MTQQEREILNEDLKKIKKAGIISIFIILFLLFFGIKSCNNEQYQQMNKKYNILKSQYQIEKSKVAKLELFNQKIKDSLDKEINKREVENQVLIFNYNELEKLIQKIKSKPINVPKDTEGLVRYFNNRYKTNENEVVENNKIGLTENIGCIVSYELEQKDKVTEVSLLQQNQIENQSNQISNLEKDKQDIKIQLSLTEQENEARKSLLKLADENIEILEKQVKKVNRRNTFNKILIPVALIGGGFIGYKIAK